VPRPVSFEKLCDVWNKRIIGIRIRKKGTNAQQYLRDGQSRTPLILENIKTNTAIRIDVTVVDTCGKVHLGRLEGIVGREMDIEKEYAACIWGVIWSHDGRLPVEHVIPYRPSRAVRWRVLAQVDKLLVDSLQRHGQRVCNLQHNTIDFWDDEQMRGMVERKREREISRGNAVVDSIQMLDRWSRTRNLAKWIRDLFHHDRS